jgi:hypothetical protein
MAHETDRLEADAHCGDVPVRAIALLALASFASAANLRVCDPLLPQIAGNWASPSAPPRSP